MEDSLQLAEPSRISRLVAFIKAHGQILALSLIIAVALALRLYGLNWDYGYGYTPHPDERAILMKVDNLSLPSIGNTLDLLDAEQSTWNPKWFPYGSFPLYLLKLAKMTSSLVPGVDLHDLRGLGRAISGIADATAIVVLFFLGRRLFGWREGLLAAGMVSITVLHIQLSHFYAVDTLLGMLTVLALYFMVRVATGGTLRDSILAGAFIGLGLATKVSMAPVFLAFFLAHLMLAFRLVPQVNEGDGVAAWRIRPAITGLFSGFAVAVVVFVIAEPYAILDRTRFISDFVEQSEMVRRIRDYPYTRQYIGTAPYLYQISQFATWGIGWPLGIVAWLGLAYASLRGARLRYGVLYLICGWLLPAALMMFSTSLIAILGATAIAFLAILAYLPFRERSTRGDLLLLAWIAPYFLTTGAFEVKFLRYLIPMTPFLFLFGSKMLVSAWEWAKASKPLLLPYMIAGILLVLGLTAFYALSYVSMYSRPHPAASASEWLRERAPKNTVILMEHWEESLPELYGYNVRQLPMYEDDRAQKLRQMAILLEEADYLVFYSNRLYGTVARLKERYPFSKQYYTALFEGRLGYRLVHTEASYPGLLGISFVDNTFSRPGLPVPDGLENAMPAGLKLARGFADESFTVYDHPLVMIFVNQERLSADTIYDTITDAVPGGIAAVDTPAGLKMSPEYAAKQYRGGTWSDIISSSGLAVRLPVLAWLIVLEAAGLLAWLLFFVVLRPLPDRGYLFSKALGLLAVSLGVWLLASLQWMAFSRTSILFVFALLSAMSLASFIWKRREIIAYVREHWRILAVGEGLFLVAFLAFVVVRMASPDLWHSHLGGEKPMELAYLNAVLKSSYMPPYDPWFSGGYLNYYYYGQFMVATLIKLTGIDTTIAFNLAVPLFFALTIAGAYSLVFNMVAVNRHGSMPGRLSMQAVITGLLGAVFVAVLGNLHGAIQVGQGLWRVLVEHWHFGAFDFWRSSRMMSGTEITEFPFFTFLFADLHAHLMAMPFTLVALGLSLAVLIGGIRRGQGQPEMPVPWWRNWALSDLIRLVVLGVVIGALRVINTWDFPTYLIVAAAAIVLSEIFMDRKPGLPLLVRSGVAILVVGISGYMAFLPFHRNYETFFSSIEGTTNQTILWQFLAITGLFIFISGSFYLYESRGWLAWCFRGVKTWVTHVTSVKPERAAEELTADDTRSITVLRLVVLLVVIAAIGYVISVVVAGWLGSTIPFVALLLLFVSVVGIGSLFSGSDLAPFTAFATVLVGMAMMLVIGLDFFRLEGDIDRMNSIFKFYLQVWVMLAVTSAYFLWRLWDAHHIRILHSKPWEKAWLCFLVLLLASASVYTVMGAQARLRVRFEVLPLTLDGMAYMHNTVYQDYEGPIDLSYDYEAIRWMQDNIKGSPIVLEGNTPTYRWGNRISIYTGLPAVIGWQWHQEQQRWGYRQEVGRRIRDVGTIYSTLEPEAAMDLMDKYGVAYVYLGQVERLYYPPEGLAKFETGAFNDRLERVYQNEQVSIFRVVRDTSGP